MEKYTTEKILNERIRELKELRDEAQKFKELIVYNEDLYVPDTNISLLVGKDKTRLLIGQERRLKGLEKVKSNIINKLFPYNIPMTAPISIGLHTGVQKEYRNNSNQLIFRITSVREFVNRLGELNNNPLVQELVKTYETDRTISSIDQQVDLRLNKRHIDIYGYNTELRAAESRFIQSLGPTWTQEMLDRLMIADFNEEDLSEYIKERIDKDSDKDYTFELINENPKYSTTAPQEGYFNREIDDEHKKIRLHSYVSRMR